MFTSSDVNARLYVPVVPDTVVLLSDIVTPLVVLYTKPLSVIAEPPSAVTFPFSVPPVAVTDVAADVVTLGAMALVVPFVVEPNAVSSLFPLRALTLNVYVVACVNPVTVTVPHVAAVCHTAVPLKLPFACT